jgi:hypothetical protein
VLRVSPARLFAGDEFLGCGAERLPPGISESLGLPLGFSGFDRVFAILALPAKGGRPLACIAKRDLGERPTPMSRRFPPIWYRKTQDFAPVPVTRR